MARKNFLPGSEGEFKVFAEVFCGAAAQYAQVLGIPQSAVTELQTLLAAYTAAYIACEAPNAGKIDRENRKIARAALTEEIRRVKNAYIDADPLKAVTDNIRIAFGLEPVDSTRTEVGVPTETVPFSVETEGYLQVAVIHPARPEGYLGAVAFFKVGGPAPTDHSELTQSKLLTRPREVLGFTESQLGQPLYITLRWENARGDLGPVAPIQTKIIS